MVVGTFASLRPCSQTASRQLGGSLNNIIGRKLPRILQGFCPPCLALEARDVPMHWAKRDLLRIISWRREDFAG
jgi:hypothetical protein